jgi:hypothetical protein
MIKDPEQMDVPISKTARFFQSPIQSAIGSFMRFVTDMDRAVGLRRLKFIEHTPDRSIDNRSIDNRDRSGYRYRSLNSIFIIMVPIYVVLQ